jgi:ADP-heptose:LPS heptosyltransferase
MKILVIQQKMIGDVLVTSVLCDNLRIAFPDAQIDYLVYESTTAVLQGNTSISNLVLFKEKYRQNRWLFFKFLLHIRKVKYDIVIDAYAKIESFLPVLFSGAKQKISFDKKGRKIIFTDLVKKISIPKTNLGLVLEQRLSLLDPLYLEINRITFPKLYVTDQEIESAKLLFEKYNLNTSKKTVMVSIIGSVSAKTYPQNYIVPIIDTLAKEYDVNILFNYMPSQIEEARAIYDACTLETQNRIYFDVLGATIREFIAIMNACDLILGNDGGAINMAKALNKPSFIIFSPWIDKKGWATFEDGSKHVSVHLKEFKPQLFFHRKDKEIKRNYRLFYQEFEPNVFKEVLHNFLNLHLNN